MGTLEENNSNSSSSGVGELGTSAMFKDEAFLEAAFEPNHFVAEQRKSLTLENLKEKLENYVGNLDNTLVNIINNDYSAFLKLSSMLVDIDSMVAGLREPLNLLENKVQKVQDVVDEPLGKQGELLERLLYIQEKKRVLELCLNARETLEKVERQVEQIQNQQQVAIKNVNSEKENEQTHLVDSIGESLGRATQRLARVSFLSQENSSLPLLRSIKVKARSLENALLEELDKAFVQTVTRKLKESNGETISSNEENHHDNKQNNQDKSQIKAIAVVLRAYVAINHREQVGQVFKRQVVKPFLKELFTQGRIDAGGERGKAAGLASLYRELLEFIKSTCDPLVQAAQDPNEGLDQIDFIGTSVCQSLHEVIQENLGQVYASGDPATLHQTYRQTTALFQVIELYSKDPLVVKNIAQQALQLWNLSVYVQLCSQERFKRLESSLAAEINLKEIQNQDPLLPGSSTLLECVKECWSADVYLESAGPRFLKLVFELCTRYACWCESALQVVREQHSIETKDSQHGTLYSEFATENPDAKIDKTAEGVWKDMQVIDAILISNDCNKVRSFLINEIKPIQEKLFGTNSQDPSALKSIEKAIKEVICADLQCIQNAVQNMIVQYFEQSCGSKLSTGLQSVAPMYRMTNKPAPTEAAPYAGTVLKDLQTFVGHQNCALLSDEEKNQIISRVFDAIITLFDSSASKILDEVVNSENALRRLKRNSANREMDSDKINVQFRLDLESIRSDISKFGMTDSEISTASSDILNKWR